MAAIVSQHQAQDVSAARAFWDAKMQEHPNIAGLLAMLGEVASFFLNGHALIRFGQWVIRVTGSVAETALMFAVIWITLASVAPGLLELFLSKQLIQFFLWIALASLAVIPEVILPNTLVNCVKHWFTAVREQRPIFWIVAVLFTVPTTLFIILTSVTIQTLNANGGNLIQASNNLLNLRCFAGWGYALLEIVYLGVKGSLPQPLRVTPAQPVQQAIQPTQTPGHPVQDERLDRLTDQVTQLASVVTQINQTVLHITQNTQYVQASTAQPGQIAANVQGVRISMDRADRPAPLLELLNQTAQDMPLLPEPEQANDDVTQSDEPASEAKQEDTTVVYPVVAGVASDVVKLVIDEHLKGIAWSTIAERTGKNYTRTVKPIKEAWTACTSYRDTSEQ